MTESSANSKFLNTRPSSSLMSKTLLVTEVNKAEANHLDINFKQDIKNEACSSFSINKGQYQLTIKNEFHTASSQNDQIPEIPGNDGQEGAKSTNQTDSYQLTNHSRDEIKDGGIQLNQMRNIAWRYSVEEEVKTNSGADMSSLDNSGIRHDHQNNNQDDTDYRREHSDIEEYRQMYFSSQHNRASENDCSALSSKENHKYIKEMSADIKATEDDKVCITPVYSDSCTRIDYKLTSVEGDLVENAVPNNLLNKARDVKVEPGTYVDVQFAEPETYLGSRTEMPVSSGSLSLTVARTTQINTNDNTIGSKSLAMDFIPGTLSEDMMPHVNTLPASSSIQTEGMPHVSTPMGILGPKSSVAHVPGANVDQIAESLYQPQKHSRTSTDVDSLSLSNRSDKEGKHNVGHLEGVPNRNKGHRCTICNMVCKYNRDLIVHMRYHTGEKPFKCTMCNYACIRKGMLKVHMRVHTGERPFKCTVCSQGFKHSNGLIYHRRLHTGERPYQCSHCDRSFKSPPELNKHAQTHSKKVSKCPTCGKEFIAEYILKKHQKVHEGKAHICTICKKDFLDPSRLKKHMTAHSDKVSSVCDICGKTFKLATRLKDHLKTHAGVKPHVCTICGKAFIQKCHLESHMNLHSGEKPFECTVCNKKFARARNLKMHMSAHTGDKPYKCTFCEKTFTYPSYKKVHMRLHTGERPYRCSVCDKGFIHKGFLNKHMKIHESG